METIFSSICDFLLANQAGITGFASNVIAGAAYDGLKNVIDFSSLNNRIKKFFKKEETTEEFIVAVCNTKSQNTAKPYRDVEDIFEQITGEKYSTELFDEIKIWIEKNKDQISSASKMEFKNKGGFNIGIQNAGKNILNIQGDYKPKKD